jgi:hypothetical protein
VAVDDLVARVFHNLIARVEGPMKFRLVLQPLMAVILATRAALRDARGGEPAFFWAVFTNPAERGKLLESGWKDVGKVFIVAILIDAVYQYIVIRWVYPGELLIVAFLLAIVPYVLVRGPLNRVLRRVRNLEIMRRGKNIASH